MKARFVYIGDAVTAAGFRLGGAVTLSPPPGEERTALLQAAKEANVVLLSTDVAEALPRAELNAALAALQPLVAIVPQAGALWSGRDPAERVRAQLGLEE